MAIRARRSGPASKRPLPLARPLSTAVSFSFGGASGGGLAGGAVNRTVPTPACTAGTAGLTPVGAGKSAYDDASGFSKNALFANAEVFGSNPGYRGGMRANPDPDPEPEPDPDSSPAPPRSYSEYAAAAAAAAATAVAAVSSLNLSLSAALALAASTLSTAARASFASRRRREVDARCRSTARLSSSERDARQLSRSATVEPIESEDGASCWRAGAGEGCRSRGRSRPSAAMLASIALDGGSAVASPPAGWPARRSPLRNANWRSRLTRDEAEVTAAPWSQPWETTGWDVAGWDLGGEATRARAEAKPGVDACERVAAGEAGGETGA